MPEVQTWETISVRQTVPRTPQVESLRKVLRLFKKHVWSRDPQKTNLLIVTIVEQVQDRRLSRGRHDLGEEAFRAFKVYTGDSQSEIVKTGPWAEVLAEEAGPTTALWTQEPEGPEVSHEDATEITPEQIAVQLLELDRDSDKPRLRELIILAEDTGFTPEQSATLAPRLLELALAYCDSSDPGDEPVVWAAIRTGASMLRPHEAAHLLPLLEPGHAIETSLVAVRMLGRIFEAQPPEGVDQYPDLASKVEDIIGSLLNSYAVAISQSAAMVQLAIYALAAMASSDTIAVTRAVRELGFDWFTQRAGRKLCELQECWQGQDSDNGSGPRELLGRALRELGVNISLV